MFWTKTSNNYNHSCLWKKVIEIPTFSIELLRFCPFYKVIHDTSDQYDFNNGVHADENLI